MSKMIVFLGAAILVMLVAWAAFTSMSARNGKSRGKGHPFPDQQPYASGADAGDENSEPEEVLGNEYLQVLRSGYGEVSVCFNIEQDKPFDIGEKMTEINEEAYMNGPGWAGLLAYVMKQDDPDLLNGMETDCEAGSYVAVYPDTEEGLCRAKRLGKLIISLIDDPDQLYAIVRDHASEIDWDEDM